MTIDERRKCIKRTQQRYLLADRDGRGRLLTDLAELTGLHRKSLVRLLRSADLARRPRVRQRGAGVRDRGRRRAAGDHTPVVTT